MLRTSSKYLLVSLATLALCAGVALSNPVSKRLIAQARKLAKADPPRLADAVAKLEQATREDPDDEDALFFLAYVAIQAEKPQVALKAVRRLDEPPRPHARFLEGRALAMLGKHEEALLAYGEEKSRADNPFFDTHRNTSLRALGRDTGDVKVEMQAPTPRLFTAASTRLEVDGRGVDPLTGQAGGDTVGRNVTALDLDYALVRGPDHAVGLAANGLYQLVDGEGDSSWVGRTGLYANLTRGAVTAGADLEVFATGLEDPGLESTGTTVRTFLAWTGIENHRPQLSYELTLRDMRTALEYVEEDRDGTLQTLSFSYTWQAVRLDSGPVQLRLALAGGREDTTGGYYDATQRSGLLSAILPAPLLPWTPGTVELGVSEDRTRYTSELQEEVLGAVRRDRTGAQWVRLRQPLKNARTSVEVRYDHSQTRSTIAGLDVGGHQGAVGLYHVF
jgi:tetratricopeptide (TPR) repeat protein